MKFSLFLESVNHENQAKNILKKKNIKNPEEVLQMIKELLEKENKKYYPLAAFFYRPERINFKYILKDFLSIANKLTANVTKKQVEITYQNKKYTFDQSNESWREFEHFVHAVQAAAQEKRQIERVQHTQEAGKLIIEKNNIEIRLARNAFDAMVLGKGTSFCISKPGTPHFNTYRLQEGMTTYFIFDRNFPSDHVLSLVVYMIDKEERILLTDLKNTTGTIQNPYSEEEDRGNYTKAYQRYLQEHGIDVGRVLVPLPLSKREREIIDRFLDKNITLEEFKQLSPQEKLDYIQVGNALDGEKARYLVDWIEKHPYDYLHIKVLHHSLYYGVPLPEDLLPRLKKIKFDKTDLLKHYLDYRVQASNAYINTPGGHPLKNYEYYFLSKKQREELRIDKCLFKKIIMDGSQLDTELLLRLIHEKNIDVSQMHWNEEEIKQLARVDHPELQRIVFRYIVTYKQHLLLEPVITDKHLKAWLPELLRSSRMIISFTLTKIQEQYPHLKEEVVKLTLKDPKSAAAVFAVSFQLIDRPWGKKMMLYFLKHYTPILPLLTKELLRHYKSAYMQLIEHFLQNQQFDIMKRNFYWPHVQDLGKSDAGAFVLNMITKGALQWGWKELHNNLVRLAVKSKTMRILDLLEHIDRLKLDVEVAAQLVIGSLQAQWAWEYHTQGLERYSHKEKLFTLIKNSGKVSPYYLKKLARILNVPDQMD